MSDASGTLLALREAAARWREADKVNPRGRNAWARDMVRLVDDLDGVVRAFAAEQLRAAADALDEILGVGFDGRVLRDRADALEARDG